MENVDGSGLTVTVTGLTGNTEYSVVVRAINEVERGVDGEPGAGEASEPYLIKTRPGVVQPVIDDVTTNLVTSQYILMINRFDDTHGGLR